MDFLSRIIVYPFIALLLVGLLFIHIGLRRRSSLASLLSATLLTAWTTLSHWALHLYLIANDETTIHRMGTHSAHPNYDTTHAIVVSILGAIFFLSFFLTAIHISSGNANRIPPPFMTSALESLKTRTLWISAASFMVISSLSTTWYRHIELINGNRAYAVISVIIALVGLTCSVLLVGIAMHRKATESRGA